MLNEKALHELVNQVIRLDCMVNIIRENKRIDKEIKKDFELTLKNLEKSWFELS